MSPVRLSAWIPAGGAVTLSGALVGAELDGRHDLAVSGAVGAQLVRDDHPRHRVSRLGESAEESLRRGIVPSVLHQDVQHHAVLVDSPPAALLLTVDLDEYLVRVPLVTR